MVNLLNLSRSVPTNSVLSTLCSNMFQYSLAWGPKARVTRISSWSRVSAVPSVGMLFVFGGTNKNTSRTLKFTLLTLFQHDTCGLQRIGLTRPFCLAGTARSDFHTRLDLLYLYLYGFQVWKSDRNLGVDMLHVGFYGERVCPVLEVKKRNFRHPSAYENTQAER